MVSAGTRKAPSRLYPINTTSRIRNLSTPQYIKVDPSDPALLEKFKCHPTIPCDIPQSSNDLNTLWYHIPDDLLPTNWSSNWLKFERACWFLPNCYDRYSMGQVDMLLKTMYQIPYPIKGVMFCTVEWLEPGGLFEQELPSGNNECLVFQDRLGDYYFYYEFSQGGDEYVAKFRAPRGTTVTEFVKDHFRGAVKGVDMDLVSPHSGDEYKCHRRLWDEQRRLVRLWEQAIAQSRCACQHSSGDAKLPNLKPVE